MISFAEVAKAVQHPHVGKESLSIWGGRIREGDVRKFLEMWPTISGMPYRIWEYASHIVFEEYTLPEDLYLLQRGRLFGEGGDLELRRDGQDFSWRYIGPAGVSPPEGYAAQSYWKLHPNVPFHQREESVLLWGRKEESRWADARVGRASLTYPAKSTWKRVLLRYRTYSKAGRVQFVWYLSLDEWKEGPK